MHNADETAGLERAGAVSPERVRVWEDDLHILHVQVDDTVHSDVSAVRAFPLSGKADYISFTRPDRKEAVLLAHPNKLDSASRKAVEKALERMYYVARITRVESITEVMGVSMWQVQTDRGYAAFEVVDSEYIRKLPGGRYLIADADGNRFEIENISLLDPRSQSIVHSEV